MVKLALVEVNVETADTDVAVEIVDTAGEEYQATALPMWSLNDGLNSYQTHWLFIKQLYGIWTVDPIVLTYFNQVPGIVQYSPVIRGYFYYDSFL